MTRLVSKPHEIISTFLARWSIATQRQIDLLLGKYAIPATSLIHDSDGEGFPLSILCVERSGRTFEFSSDPEIRPVCGFLARDRWGEAQDIVAWSPGDGWAGTWLGRAALLGEHELSWPRIGEPLQVHLDMLDWMQAGRTGVVLLDEERGARELRDWGPFRASNVKDGRRLHELLIGPMPSIVVPEPTEERRAA